MKKTILSLLISLVSSISYANTLAGTVISNFATVDFYQNGKKLNIQSPVTSFTVNELIDVQLVWIDISPVPVSSPDTQKVLTFKLTNTGNSNQKYSLSQNNQIGGGQFNPIIQNNNQIIYVENGLQPGLQLNGAYLDNIYSNGSTISVEPGESKILYLIYDIPNNQTTNNKGYAQISAISNTQGVSTATKPGLLNGIIENGVEVILGYTMGKGSAIGNYIVSGVNVTNNKSVINVLDTSGGNVIQSGSIITYQIKGTFTGTGIIKNVQIVDNLPSELSYVNNSLTLNGVSISDTNNVNNNNILINIGDVKANTIVTVTFKAKIN
jgi:uncharacterized repeat protein (TIGR01451 family)